MTHQKDTLFEIGDRIVYISLPERVQKSDSVAYPVLMALHGSGRNALNYLPGQEESVSFYVHQRNLALKNGYLFVVLSNGNDTWGTDLGLKNLLKVYEYIRSNYKVKEKWVLWGTSAGGVQMFRMIRNHPEKIERIIGTFPVYDLEEAYSRRKSANFIWQSREEFKSINPATFPEKLINIPMLIFHGRKDQAVPYEKHSLRLKKEVNALGGSVKLRTVSGGHSTSNWKVYKNHQINKFLSK
ncbi:alpha/beta hydrolase family protein [Cyclobacterium lianum]|uniref:alpha/beta hydrolase family protein n=1 Tax=Cyclobacterium lianum TaxID=388280 RepID=UPI0015B5915E|nr:prolyl oligopeptidase family serine peptidase [Cyclobacterium lianum]